jgi:anthranilate synthase/aminodeoxychorismate synthase-like glutamine amidotransferase
MNITFIDHYDSFSFNVLGWLESAATSNLHITRITCDDLNGLDQLSKNLTPIVISPGPGTPSNYPGTTALIKKAMLHVPIFGICLGHQMIGELAGGKIIRAKDTWHGTVENIEIMQQHWLTTGLSRQFKAVTYNSLVVQMPDEANAEWSILAKDRHGQNMILAHKNLDVASVQFHPESFASDNLTLLAKNFLARIK